jgi:hypothetical protein
MEEFNNNIIWLITTWFGRYIFAAMLTVFGGVLIEHVYENWLTYGIYYAGGAGIVLNLLAQIVFSIIKIKK